MTYLQNINTLIFTLLIFALPITQASSRSEIYGHEYEVHTVSYSKSGQLLASGSGDKTVIIWNTKTQTPLFTIEEHKRTVYSVAFSKLHEDLLATSSSDGHLILWNVSEKTMIKTLVKGDTTSNGITAIDFSPTQNLLAIAYMGGEVALWDTKNFKLKKTFHAHPKGFAMSVRFSPDGQKLTSTGGIDSTVKLLNSSDLSLIQSFEQEKKPDSPYQDVIWNTSFSPDGATIASVSTSGRIHLWREGQTTPHKEFIVDHHKAITVQYSINGKKLYVGVDASNSNEGNSVLVFDPNTGALTNSLNAHKNRIRGMALSPNGQQLATASWDFNVILWEL